jgi:hypothetical protein
MVAINMELKPNSNIIIEKIFLANRVLPLAIQRDEQDKTVYKILFKINETISDNFIFFEIRLKAEDDLDRSYIESKSIFIDNLMKDKDKYSAFKTIMKEYDQNKFYVGSFKFITTPTGINYIVKGFKEIKLAAVASTAYETMNVYIPRYMYIILSLYLEDFTNPYSTVEKEFLFLSDEMLSLRFEKVENVKLVASTKVKMDNGLYQYITHYEMNCGPTFWRFNYDIITEEDLELKEPLAYDTFKSEYSQYDSNLIGTVGDNGLMYIVTRNDKDKIVALKVSSALANKTNLINPYFIFKDNN